MKMKNKLSTISLKIISLGLGILVIIGTQPDVIQNQFNTFL